MSLGYSLQLVDFERLLELPNTDNEVLASGTCLLNAINDWPNEVSTLEEFELAVKEFLGCEPTRINIAIGQSNLDYSKEAWYAESLAQVIQSLEMYPDEPSLNGLIGYLEMKVRS